MSSIFSNLINLAGNLTGVLPVANGGTNSSTTLNSNRFVISSGGKIVEASAVTASAMVASDSNGLPTAADPANLADAQATLFGLKQYVAGTNYNGGISPTVTGANWTTTRGVFIPRKMQDGAWRLEYNVVGTLSSGTSSLVLTFNGVTFKNTANYNQACGIGNFEGSSTNNSQGYVNPNAATIQLNWSTSLTHVCLSAVVELDSKPTWAY